MFTCKYCYTNYSTYNHYKTHISTKKHYENLTKMQSLTNNQQSATNISQITLVPESDQQSTKLESFKCKCCNKILASKFSLKRHYKICKSAQNLIDENTMDIIDNLLESKLDKSMSNDKQNITIVINNNNTNNINNNNINNTNNTNNNVNIELSHDDTDDVYAPFYGLWNKHNVNPFGYEDLSMFDDQAIADRIHSDGLNAFMEFKYTLFR